MVSVSEYKAILINRYSRLYGKENCGEKVKKDLRNMIVIVVLLLLSFLLITFNSITLSKAEYCNAEINKQGELTGIIRPEKDGDSYSFTTKVLVVSDDEVNEKEYYITIEPLNDAGSTQSETQDLIIPEKDTVEEELKQLISSLNEDRGAEKILLPQKLESGERLIWLPVENKNPVLYLIVFLVALCTVYRNRFYGVEAEEKKARESVIKELPDFINKLVLLVNAGVILNSAFMKIVDDCDDKKIDSSYFYKRINGIGYLVKETNASFHQEIYFFAKNSGVKEFMRITNIMMDNISKGDDLSEKLRRENELLWFARKQQAEEKGRLAETKLTLPLMILLTALIVITIAPAMMEI